MSDQTATSVDAYPTAVPEKYYYRKDDGSVELATDKAEWVDDFKTKDPVIARDVIGKVAIETFFLGFDHTHPDSKVGPPLLWRTRIVPADPDSGIEINPADYPKQVRYATEAEALAGHADVVAKVGA